MITDEEIDMRYDAAVDIAGAVLVGFDLRAIVEIEGSAGAVLLCLLLPFQRQIRRLQ